VIGPCCRISWYIRCSMSSPDPSGSISLPAASPGGSPVRVGSAPWLSEGRRRRRPGRTLPGLPGEGCVRCRPRSSGANTCPRISWRKRSGPMEGAVGVALERDGGTVMTDLRRAASRGRRTPRHRRPAPAASGSCEYDVDAIRVVGGGGTGVKVRCRRSSTSVKRAAR
jgi:hypothetical protein